MKTLLLSLLISLFAPVLAAAAETNWLETDGGNVRLVVAPVATGEQALRGIIEIGLLPGWKTYWRNPGSGGIPPAIEVSNGTMAKIAYPAPVWIDTKYGSYAGYETPVLLPFEIDLNGFQASKEIDVRLMVGICEDICIPAFADFSLPIEKAVGSDMNTVAVARANSALPQKPELLGLEITQFKPDATGVTFTIKGNLAVQALFAAGDGDVQFAKPLIINQSAGNVIYRADYMSPAKSSKPIIMHIVGKTLSGAFKIQQEITPLVKQ